MKDLGLALSPKIPPDQSQPFKQVNNSQEFTVGRTKNVFFFLNEPLPGAARRVSTKFRADIRRTDCVGPILSHI